MFSDIEPQTLLILGVAFIGLIISLTLLFIPKKGRETSADTIRIFTFLLFLLFPVLVLFVFFDNFIEGTFMGYQVGGAIAAYFALFYFIWTQTKKEVEEGTLREEINVLEAEKEAEANTFKQKINELETQIKQANKPIGGRLTYVKKIDHKVKGVRGRYVGLVTGDIADIKHKELDIWVNSENTNMQMARFFDKNISGAIRYLGAKKDDLNKVKEDLIANELAVRMGSEYWVKSGTVIATGAGELTNTHGVKKIIHVASVQGDVGAGYKAVDKLGACVGNVLEMAEKLSVKSETENYETIMIPILGSGAGGKSFEEAAKELIEHAIMFFENNHDSQIKRVYFLASRQSKLEKLQKIIEENDKLS